jgi:predicted dehydrogenase
MTALGVHLTDYIQTILGRVQKVNANLGHRSDSYPGDDVLNVELLFASELTGHFCSLATTPFYQRITLFGDRGWVEIREESNVNEPEPAWMTLRGLDNKVVTRSFEKTDTVSKNLEAWANAVNGNGTYRFTSQELLHNVEILQAIVDSANTGKPAIIDPR